MIHYFLAAISRATTMAAILTLLALSFCQAATVQKKLSYNRDVLPILSAKCFACHGADSAKRQADLRLDQHDSVTRDRQGRRAIVPGKADQSELIHRIFSNDDDLSMPPPHLVEQLSLQEKNTLKHWINEGAAYETHWAFQAARKTSVPRGVWGRNPIDRFVYRRLKVANLTPQNPATKEQLLRRGSFDLTGLPPTLDELGDFLADRSPNAWERVIDRLLSSPRYGERMAMWWLDGAHYGDSHGYDNDLENSQWPWRNWVIASFNRNQPFDEFTIEQLAGDLLPNASEQQILATAFNRNHRIQTEDGAIDEEWRTEYVIDRVETMGTVWMGLSLGCCRCHDHKFDPITQREFYQLFALFNNLDEKGFVNNLRGSAEPRIRYQSERFQRELTELQRQTAEPTDRHTAIHTLEARYPWVMIMREMSEPRPAYILKRGHYDAMGERVFADFPQALPAPATGYPVTRLTFARWLVEGRHPLTARVILNRLWEQLFGTAIVESSENLGVQADWPSHPDLLDWLAVELVASDWDVKEMLRMIMLSETYRQSHAVDSERLQRDPRNRLISRGPRVRLPAEMIRDQALVLAGLLHEEIGGASVRPYQPAGLWEEVEKRGTYQQDHGQSLYRRSVYTAIRKTVAPPEMVLFDLPSRELCTVKRLPSNTPLQALNLMNNVTFVEAARKFAERMLDHGTSPSESIRWGFRLASSREPTLQEQQVLARGYQRRHDAYQQTPQQAKAVLAQGESPLMTHLDPIDLAAMTTVASIILNLDELINK
ncbi:MAG: PSD1 and planctomycete cytochrome C domain-containing protein [Pirellulaceae bacterium]|nr:PSD1 and planctomycete cytochrome C domain-containing protein [Pirellulaceae bacterium]